jgi:hypothetical protein
VSCWELEGIRTAKLSAALAERGGTIIAIN